MTSRRFTRSCLALLLVFLLPACPQHRIPFELKAPPTAAFTWAQNDLAVSFDASISSDTKEDVSLLQVRWDFNNDGDWDTAWNLSKTTQHKYTSVDLHRTKLEVKNTSGLTASVVIPLQRFPPEAPPGTFKDNSSGIKLKSNVVPLTAAEGPIWDWPNGRLTITKPNTKNNIKVGSILMGDASVVYSAKVLSFVQSGVPTILRIAPAGLPDIIAGGTLDFTCTPDWRTATSASAQSFFDPPTTVPGFDRPALGAIPEAKLQILADGTIVLDELQIIDLAIDQKGKIDYGSSKLFGFPLQAQRASLKRINTTMVKGGHIRAKLLQGAIRIVPTAKVSYQGFPFPHKAEVTTTMKLRYSFDIELDVSGGMELEIVHQLIPQLSWPVVVGPVQFDVDLRMPLTFTLSAAVAGKAVFSYEKERLIELVVKYDRSAAPRFGGGLELRPLRESKSVDWKIVGRISSEFSVDPQIMFRFYKVIGPYIYGSVFVRSELEFPWLQNKDDLFIGFGAGAGLELGNPWLRTWDYRSPRLYEKVWSFDLRGRKGGGSANQPPSAFPISLTLPLGGGPIQLLGSDPNVDPLTYSIETKPAKGHLGILSKKSGIVQYRPSPNSSGLDSFTYSVFDGKERSEPRTVSIVVRNGMQPTAAFAFSSVGNKLKVDAYASSDRETPKSQLAVRWDWRNNGIWTAWTTKKTAEYTYPAPGSYVVKLQVMDSSRMVSSTLNIVYLGDSYFNSIGMELNMIKNGSFTQGTPAGELDRYWIEGPQRTVTISRSFYAGVTEVTQSQWTKVMSTEPWKQQKNVKYGDDYPAVYVSWQDAVLFCKKLGTKEGKVYRLPTEAEWEYLCRAGTKTRFSFGDDPKYSALWDHAWFKANARMKNELYAHLVAKKKPNPWGLYDVHGNVWEWCQDWYSFKYPNNKPVTDPKGPSTGKVRTIRGGSWGRKARFHRSGYRGGGIDTHKEDDIGFRVILEVK